MTIEFKAWPKITRIDNNKGYSKENCRWATGHEQRMNQRRMKNE